MFSGLGNRFCPYLLRHDATSHIKRHSIPQRRFIYFHPRGYHDHYDRCRYHWTPRDRFGHLKSHLRKGILGCDGHSQFTYHPLRPDHTADTDQVISQIFAYAGHVAFFTFISEMKKPRVRSSPSLYHFFPSHSLPPTYRTSPRHSTLFKFATPPFTSS